MYLWRGQWSPLFPRNNCMQRNCFNCLLLAFILISTPNISFASAGYYPVDKGQTLKVITCVPQSGRSAKPPLILNIQWVKTNNKKVEVARISKWGKTQGSCGKWEYQVTIPWKINVTGAYSLSIYAPNSQVDPDYVWPDGVDIPENSQSSAKNNDVANILIRLRSNSNFNWIEDPSVPIGPGAKFAKFIQADFLSTECGVFVLSDEHSADPFFDSWTGKDYWVIKDNESGYFVRIQTDSGRNSSKKSCVIAAGKTFNYNLTN